MTTSNGNVLTARGAKELQTVIDQMATVVTTFPNLKKFPVLAAGYGPNKAEKRLAEICQCTIDQALQLKVILELGKTPNNLALVKQFATAIIGEKATIDLHTVEDRPFYMKISPKNRDARTNDDVFAFFGLSSEMFRKDQIDAAANALSAHMPKSDAPQYLGAIVTPDGSVHWYIANDTAQSSPNTFYWLARIKDYAKMSPEMQALIATELNKEQTADAPEVAKENAA